MSKLSSIHLSKANSLCHEWMLLQNSSIALLSSTSNIVQQRSATASSSTSLMDDALKSSLIYKQTTVFEENMEQFRAIIPRFRAIVDQLTNLVTDSAKNALYAANETVATPPRPGTSAAMLALAEISEDQASVYISQIRDMYHREYNYKVTLSNQLHQQPNLDATVVNDMISLWSSQPQVDFTVEKEMAERLNLYKKVKRVVEAKD